MTRPLLIYTHNAELRKVSLYWGKWWCGHSYSDCLNNCWSFLSQPVRHRQAISFPVSFDYPLTQPSFLFLIMSLLLPVPQLCSLSKGEVLTPQLSSRTSQNWPSSATSAPSLSLPLDFTNQRTESGIVRTHTYTRTTGFSAFHVFAYNCSVSLQSFVSCSFLFILHESAQERLLLFS